MSALSLLLITSSLLVVACAVMAINHMSLRTPLIIGIAHIGLAIGALASALAPFYGRAATLADCIVMPAVAVLLISSRRFRARRNFHQGQKQ